MLIGVVGKPNVGKSTFFKASTSADVKIANYPFATIDPNHDTGFVRVECAEKHFNVKCNPRYGRCENNIRLVPVEMVDVAGLVPGAHEGKGMGNQFLSDLNEANVLIHVIDASGQTNEKGEICNDYNPINDVRFLEEELDYWYKGILMKGWKKFCRISDNSSKELSTEISDQLSGFRVSEEDVKKCIKTLNLSEKASEWDDENIFNAAKFLRRKTKPIIIAANKMDKEKSSENLEALKKEFPDIKIIPCSADFEVALNVASKKNLLKYVPGDSSFEICGDVNDKQKQALEKISEFMKKFNSTGVQETINKAVFELLGYMHIFPGGMKKLGDKDGNILPDCFLLKPESTALDFAYSVHSDIGKNFIRAIDVKTGMTVGKEHKLKNGDVIEIIANK